MAQGLSFKFVSLVNLLKVNYFLFLYFLGFGNSSFLMKGIFFYETWVLQVHEFYISSTFGSFIAKLGNSKPCSRLHNYPRKKIPRTSFSPKILGNKINKLSILTLFLAMTVS